MNDPIVPRRWTPFHDDRPVVEEVIQIHARVAGQYSDWSLDGVVLEFFDEWEEKPYLIRFQSGTIYLVEGRKETL